MSGNSIEKVTEKPQTLYIQDDVTLLHMVFATSSFSSTLLYTLTCEHTPTRSGKYFLFVSERTSLKKRL